MMDKFKKLEQYLQDIADANPSVLELPVMVFIYIDDFECYSLASIDYCFEQNDIMSKTKLKGSTIDWKNIEVVDEFYEDVVCNMNLDDYEREVKYLADIDEDDEIEYIVMLKRNKNTFEIKTIHR